MTLSESVATAVGVGVEKWSLLWGLSSFETLLGWMKLPSAASWGLSVAVVALNLLRQLKR
jgi:hypothetical protein